jgi:hypothetical protein
MRIAWALDDSKGCRLRAYRNELCLEDCLTEAKKQYACPNVHEWLVRLTNTRTNKQDVGSALLLDDQDANVVRNLCTVYGCGDNVFHHFVGMLQGRVRHIAVTEWCVSGTEVDLVWIGKDERCIFAKGNSKVPLRRKSHTPEQMLHAMARYRVGWHLSLVLRYICHIRPRSKDSRGITE